MILRSTPRLTRPVWAGAALSERYRKPPGEPFVGESWEVWRENPLVAHPDRRLADVVDFPLLIKLISTREVLSVQVHPDDATAHRHGAASGKAEAWVILEAAPDARVALGLRREVSRDALRDMALSGEIEQELAWFPVRPGDVIDVPCGTIHAIGGGITLYEVQQPADITWRLYDWGRGRELHLDDALEVALRTPAVPPLQKAGTLIEGPIFTVREATLGDVRGSTWRALTCTTGTLRIDGEPLNAGDTVLVGPGAARLEGEGMGLWAGLGGAPPT